MKAEYRVRWEIDVDADGTIEAAQIAEAMLLDKSNTARVFEVYTPEGTLLANVDLCNEEDHEKEGRTAYGHEDICDVCGDMRARCTGDTVDNPEEDQ